MSHSPPLLQIALDHSNTAAALALLAQVYPHVDIVEIGTPLIIEDGLLALETLKARFPDKQYLADLKIMDAGYIEAASAFKRGADIVTVLGVADDTTIKGALQAAAEYDRPIMADLVNVPNVVERARELEALGVPILCLHTAYDRQSEHASPLANLETLRPLVKCWLAIAGGLNLETGQQAARLGASIVVVGGSITNQPQPGEVARVFYEELLGRSA